MSSRSDLPTVCHISPLGNTKGGITTVVMNYVMATDWPVRFAFIESHCDGSALKKLAHMLRALGRSIALRLSRKIDIVQIHVGDFPSIYRKIVVALPLMFLAPCRTILHMHGADFLNQYERQPPLGRWLVRQAMKRFDLVIALSEQWRADLQLHYDIKSILVLPNAVDVPPTPPVRDTSCPRNFLFFGLIGPRKGVFDLLSATTKLVREGIPLALRIGGNGEVQELQLVVQEEGLSAVVSYLGWVTGDERDKVVASSHVLVLPSYAEGAPMALIEGMAMGMPIISTRVGAIPEMVKDGVNGFLVEPGDVDALARAMASLCLDDDLWREMSRQSHVIARQKFSLESHKKTLLGAYARLMETKPRS